jgi:hypothetical protein
MQILDFYYNEDREQLYIEFSTKEDKDDYYRILELEYSDIEYYSPDIIDKRDILNMTKSFIKDVIEQYLKENDLPEPITL